MYTNTTSIYATCAVSRSHLHKASLHLRHPYKQPDHFGWHCKHYNHTNQIGLNNEQRALFKKPTRQQNPGFWKAVGLCGFESVILKHSFLKHMQRSFSASSIHPWPVILLATIFIYIHTQIHLLSFSSRGDVWETDVDGKRETGAFLLSSRRDTDPRRQP